ncbi:MAG: hypothetical protein WC717_03085 [Candidatus Micrarchaeia archaeon]
MAGLTQAYRTTYPLMPRRNAKTGMGGGKVKNRIAPSQAPLVDERQKSPSERINDVIRSMRAAVKAGDAATLGKKVDEIAKIMKECAGADPKIRLYQEGMADGDWNYSVYSEFGAGKKAVVLSVTGYERSEYEGMKNCGTLDASAEFSLGGEGILAARTRLYGAGIPTEREILFGARGDILERSPDKEAGPLAEWLCSLMRLPENGSR